MGYMVRVTMTGAMATVPFFWLLAYKYMIFKIQNFGRKKRL